MLEHVAVELRVVAPYLPADLLALGSGQIPDGPVELVRDGGPPVPCGPASCTQLRGVETDGGLGRLPGGGPLLGAFDAVVDGVAHQAETSVMNCAVSPLRPAAAVRLVDAFWVRTTARTTVMGSDAASTPATSRVPRRRRTSGHVGRTSTSFRGA